MPSSTEKILRISRKLPEKLPTMSTNEVAEV